MGHKGHSNTTKGNAARAALALCATALALFVLLAASTAQASMSVKGFFGSEGSGAGQLNNPSGIAINQSGAGSGAEAGDLYLADQGNNRVDQFSAAGSFVRAFGAGVVASGPGDKGGSPELQSVKIAAGGGTFTLSYNSAITTPIAFNASPASVEAALNGLVTIGGAGHAVSVTGGPGDPTGSTPYLVSFGGDLSGQDVAELGLNTENLLAGAGGTLTCHTDTQNPGSPLPITSYVWLRNGAPIAGATTETYELAAADAGTVVQCENFVYPKEDENGAEAPNPGPDEVWGPKNTAMGVGAPRTGKAAFVVAPAPATFPPVLTKASFGPSESKELVTGGAGGQKLNCPKGTWSGSPTFTYQWYRAGVPIAGATAQSFTVQAAEIAEPTRFQCTVFATNAGGTAVQNIGEVVTKPPPPHEPVYSNILPSLNLRPYLVDPSKLTTTAPGRPNFEVCEPANGDVCRSGVAEAADHGGMSGPHDVAVDPVSGEVFSSGAALDSGRIEIFGSDGSFEGAFGWGVVDGSPELQFCTAICKEGLPGSKAGQLINAVAMAVDPLSGDLYVADRIAGRVDRFALTHGLGGEVTGASFVNAFGWGVDTGAGAFETCTTASGCQAGVKAGGENVGEFREFALNDIAVSPAGTIYTVECCRSGPGRAQSFTPAGPTYTPAEFAPGLLKSASSSSAPIAVAIGESGHLLIARGFAAAEGTPPAASAEKRILEFDSAGTLLDTHIAGAAIDSVNGIAQNTATGKAYATSTTGGQRVYVLGGSLPLSVSKTGTGTGTVTSSPTGIECGEDCKEAYEEGTEVTLTATPASGSTFSGWSGGGCSGTASCKVTMSGVREVTAEFTKEESGPVFHKLTITVTGNGSVSANTGTISGCTSVGGASCEGEYEQGAHVTLTETPGEGSLFNGWQTLQCDESTASTCEVTIGSGDEGLAADFTAAQILKVSTEGPGTITSSPGLISCTPFCEDSFPQGTKVTLTATPAPGSIFMAWKHCDSGGVLGSHCTVAMDKAKTVTAVFASGHALTVKSSGLGKVQSYPAGISCLYGCQSTTAAYNATTKVTLKATPAKHFHFAGWSGDCSGTGACEVTMGADREVKALFAENTKQSLTLTSTGAGRGIVKSHPTGINCGYTCISVSASFDQGEEVTLEVSKVALGSTFTGWSGGGCSGIAPTCTVAMSEAKEVTAEFK